MVEKNATKISLSTFFLIFAIIAIVVMGVFIYKLNNDKTAEIQKSTELQSQVNRLNGTVSDLQEKLNNVSEIVENKPIVSETAKNETIKKETDSSSENLTLSKLIQILYPNSTGNFSRDYFGAININLKYDGNESEIKVTINENNFDEKIGTKKLLLKNSNLKEKVIDLSIGYNIIGKGIYTITILTENGNAYTAPWIYSGENTAELFKIGENVLRLGDGGGFDKTGKRVFFSDNVYIDGE